ncbi:MAG TPA: ATP-binding protein [Anaeromyxobacteraceae bacterium]
MSMQAATLEATAPKASAPMRGSVDQRGDTNRIKLSWLIRLHWGGVVGQTASIFAARWISKIDVPLRPLLSLVALEVVVNVALVVWLRRTGRVRERVIVATMFFDAVFLTALLALSGGFSNPFSTMYLVNVALATVLLDAAWAWAMVGLSLALYAMLFALDHVGVLQVLTSFERHEMMAVHMQGMWVAFAVSAAFIVYIMQRVQVALTQVEQALAEERSLSARKDKVASLATLAAGAAHELATPLSTIAVAVKELQRSAQKEHAPQHAIDDLALIREQVARCRDILHHMSAQAGENAGEPILAMPLAEWVKVALAHLPDRGRVELRADVDLGAHAVAGPPNGLARALRGLLKNALQASPADRSVLLRVDVEEGMARAQVVDQGCGMPADILSRAGEPFFTTKVPGEGMGLGLFLTQTLTEQLGGGLDLRSIPGTGTIATITLPIAPTRRSEAT